MESGDDIRQWRKVDRGKARHANWTGIQTPLPWSLLSDTLGDCLEMRRDEREEEEKSRRRSLPPLICPRNYPSFLLAGKCLIILEILGEKVGRIMGKGTSSLKELRVFEKSSDRCASSFRDPTSRESNVFKPLFPRPVSRIWNKTGYLYKNRS